MKNDVSPLEEAESLLRKYGNTPQADRIAACIKQIQVNGSGAYQELATGYWWGGSGSIADILLNRLGRQPDEEEKIDNRRYRASLKQIYELMQANGVMSEAAARWF